MQQEQLDRAALREPPDPLDLREREHKAQLVLRVLRGLRGQPDQQGLRELLVYRAQQVRQEIRELREQLARQG